MSFLLRLFGLVALLPSLAHAATLEIPGNGVTLSGVGVISGWKCEAGDITIRLNDGDPIPATYGLPRTDTSGVCDNDGNNGFFSYTNWGNLGDGTHTAVAYDDGEEFGRSTFEVVTFGTKFLTGAGGECRIQDFPMPGESTLFEWDQATQHLEAVSRDLACIEALTLESGETCSSSIPLTTPLGEVSLGFTFSVENGQGCISGGTPVDGCYPDSLPEILDEVGISVTRHDDGSWTLDSFPFVDIGTCEVGLTVRPGETCSNSINFAGQEIGFTITVDATGQACAEVTGVTVQGGDPCFDTTEDFDRAFGVFGAAVTRNEDGSWTIDRFPSEDQ